MRYPNPPQNGRFRRFSPYLFLQGASLASPQWNENHSKSARFEVFDFEKGGFLFYQGIKRSKPLRVYEYFNDDRAEIPLFKTVLGYLTLP